MLKKGKVWLALCAMFLGFASLAHGQDSQSLGDAARQARLQKQQKEAAAPTTPAANASDTSANSASPAPPPRVITNDEIPSHVGPTVTSTPNPQSQYPVSYQRPTYGQAKTPAETWKAQILAQKTRISQTEAEIARASSARVGNCVVNCFQHNERLQQRQQQLDAMNLQLQEQRKQLDQMQETARRQGYGSSVYDP
jgi:hypothetical protein